MSLESPTVLNTPHDAENSSPAMKLFIVWTSTITGLTVTEWAALFACVYTLLQIYILLRDKIFKKDK